MTIAKAPRRKVESEGGSILTSEYAGVNNETTSQYEKVDVQRALLSCPEGFYSHYDMIPSEHRKLVLLRLPKNVSI